MKLEAKQRLLASNFLKVTFGEYPNLKSGIGTVVGTDGAGNEVIVFDSRTYYGVFIVHGGKLIAMANADSLHQAKQIADLAIKSKATRYWSDSNPLKDFLLNNHGLIQYKAKPQ